MALADQKLRRSSRVWRGRRRDERWARGWKLSR